MIIKDIIFMYCNKTIKVFMCAFYFLFLPISVVFAGTETLPAPEEVNHIRVEPHDGKIKDFYTPASLLQALPHLQETTLGKTLAFGKVWLWQKGIIYLKNGKELHWRSFTDNIIQIDTHEGPVFYTDILSQTSAFTDGKSPGPYIPGKVPK